MDMDFDETEASEGTSSIYRPSYILVAIDTHASMFESDTAPSPFKNSINALYRLSDSLLLKTDKRGWSPFAITLCDKDEKANLVNFKDNMIETNKLLKAKYNMKEGQLKAEYMRDYDVDLAAFFQFCKKKFKDIGTTFYKRIMIFITDDPDPVRGDATKRFTALNEAKNFDEHNIDFQLVVTKEDFKFDVFYDELFSLLNQEKVENICEDEEGLYEKLTTHIIFRQQQRKLVFYPFANDKSKFITCYKKSYLKNPRLLNNDFVASDGSPVIRIRKQNTENEEVVENKNEFVLTNVEAKTEFPELKFDINDKIELEEMRFPLGFTLLYVSDRLTGIGDVIAEPRILEADYKEELPYFKQFWQFCVNRDKVLVCAQVLKVGGEIRGVELIPKLIHGNKVFLIKQIPFADEIFEEPPIVKQEANLTEDQKKAIDKLISQLALQFSSSLIQNEAEMKKEAYLKSKLLDEPRQEVEHREILTSEQIDEVVDCIKYLEYFPPEQGTKRKKGKK